MNGAGLAGLARLIGVDRSPADGSLADGVRLVGRRLGVLLAVAVLSATPVLAMAGISLATRCLSRLLAPHE